VPAARRNRHHERHDCEHILNIRHESVAPELTAAKLAGMNLGLLKRNQLRTSDCFRATDAMDISPQLRGFPRSLIPEGVHPMRMISLSGASALLALGLSAVAVAAADPMAGVYGNTVVVTNAKGEVSKIWINKDGTYKAAAANGQAGTGKWVVKDNNTKYCVTPDLPATAPAGTPAPKESCSEFHGGKKPGDKWQQKDAEGQPISVEVKAGA
jgi:hypothetical protein